MPTSPVFKSNQQAKPKLLSSVSVKPQPKPATIAPANTISDTAKQNQLAFDRRLGTRSTPQPITEQAKQNQLAFDQRLGTSPTPPPAVQSPMSPANVTAAMSAPKTDALGQDLTKLATLVNPKTGQKQVVRSDSPVAKQFFGQGYVLEGSEQQKQANAEIEREKAQQQLATSIKAPSSTAEVLQEDTRTQPASVNPTPDAITQLRQAILQNLTQSESERVTAEQLGELISSSNEAIAGVAGQGRGITADLVTGQQGAIRNVAAAEAQTLEQRLARKEAERRANLQQAQTLLGFEQADKEQQLVQEQANQQKLESLALEAAKQGATPEEIQGILASTDFGQALTGASQYLQAPEDPMAQLEYEKAQLENLKLQQELNGTLTPTQQLELQKKQLEIQKLENEIYGGGGNAKDLTADQAKARQFANTATEANNLLDTIGYDPGLFESSLVPNALKSPERQQFEQASRAFVNSVLRRESGAVISDDEFKNKYKELIPQAGDSDAVKQQKAQMRKTAINSIREAGLLGGSGDPLDSILDEIGFNRDLDRSIKGLGSLSEKFESGGDPGAIGYDSTGGYSYGTYQLAHNNAKKFVDQSKYADAFKGVTFNSKEFRQRWEDLALLDPEGFAQEQKSYIAKTHYDPQVKKIQNETGVNINSLPNTIKDVVWSTAVQHGANTSIIVNAIKSLAGNLSAESLVNKIYDLRWSGGQQFRSSTDQVKRSVKNRFDQERQIALSQLRNTA